MKALKRLGKGFRSLWGDCNENVINTLILCLIAVVTFGTIVLIVTFPILFLTIPVGLLAWLFVTAWKRGSEDVQ